MRRRNALTGIAVVFALLVGSVALSAPRSAIDTDPAVRSVEHVSVSKLLRARLDWTLRLARALRVLEQAPDSQSGEDTQTIIEDPDPVGLVGDDDDDNEQESGEEEREEQEDGANQGSDPMKEFGS